MKALGYLWASSKGQLPRQRAAVKVFAEVNGYVLVREFADIGVSAGVEDINRPAFTKMVATLHSNGVRTVIVDKLERLAPSLMKQEAVLSYFKQNGFSIVSVAEPDLIASDPRRIAFRQMLNVFAQYDKSMIGQRLAGARMRKRAQTGHCEGRKPYGFYQGEAAVLDRIKALRAEKLGFDRIAVRLNEEGLPTRTGKPWHGVVVNRILTGKRQAATPKELASVTGRLNHGTDQKTVKG